MKIIPTKCTVLVIGAGPAGSSAATLLAQSGIDVVVLEKALFPRNQVGENLIPHFWQFADLLGVTEKIQQAGFISKLGGVTVWRGKVRQVKFSDFGYTRPGLHVERDIFDSLLLGHAESCGATAITQVSVKRVDFSDAAWPKVYYLDKRGDAALEGVIQCQYVVDASGHSAFLAGQFGARQMVHSNLNFLSLWGYYKNSRYVGVDRRSYTTDHLVTNPPVTFVTSYAEGWIWHILLRDKASVGLVVHTDKTKGMDKWQRELFFKDTCAQTPHLQYLLAEAEFIQGSLEFRPDYSYYSTQACGENYYCIGDAGAFVDPIFSHGVQNAFYNAAISTLAIKEALKNPLHRHRYSQLCESRMQQFYGFCRALALGDYGDNGVKPALVKPLMQGLPPLELKLLYWVSQFTDRSDNFIRLAREAGIWERFEREQQQQDQEELSLNF